MTLAALMAREYGWSWTDYLAAEPAFTHMMYAAACEHAGLEVTNYVDEDINIIGINRIMSGEVAY